MTVKKNERKRSYTTTKVADLDKIPVYIDDKEFLARPRIPGAVLLDFINAGTDGAAIAAQMKTFLEASFEPEVYASLKETLYDAENIVDEELIGTIVSDLIEEYAASRPTGESE